MIILKVDLSENLNIKEAYIMDMYEEIAELDSDKNEMGVSPLSYVTLGCAR